MSKVISDDKYTQDIVISYSEQHADIMNGVNGMLMKLGFAV